MCLDLILSHTLVLAKTGLAFSLLLRYLVGNSGPLFLFFSSTHTMASYISISSPPVC